MYLAVDIESFLEIIFDKLCDNLRKNHYDDLFEDFLRSLDKDIPNVDIMHNKYFNYVTEEDSGVHIPCRFYLFDDIQLKTPRFETVYFDVDETGDFSPAEMSLSAIGTDSLNNALKKIQKIQRYQTVTIVFLNLCSLWFEKPWISKPDDVTLCDQIKNAFLNTIKLNKNTSYLRLFLGNMFKSVLEYLAQELHGCEGMKFLSLDGAENNFPIELGESIATMTSLEMVELRDLTLTSNICEAVLRGLSACSRLKSLRIGNNVLTDCFHYLFMESNHYGFPCLKELEITKAELSTGDLSSLAIAVSGGKLPQLKKIDLSGNMLTDKVGILMGFPKRQCIVYQCLQALRFAKCTLNQTDVRSISQALAGNQFPKLQSLNLGYNTLTNCIIDLFGAEVDSSFPSLIELDLSCTQLSARDLRTLSRAFSHRVMSNCKKLYLWKNKLTGIVAELFAGNGLPFVSTLKLEHVQLNATDIENIAGAIENSKLPALTDLYLEDRYVFMTEDQVKQLLEACIAVYTTHHMGVHLTLDGASDYAEMDERLSERCKGTGVTLLSHAGKAGH